MQTWSWQSMVDRVTHNLCAVLSLAILLGLAACGTDWMAASELVPTLIPTFTSSASSAIRSIPQDTPLPTVPLLDTSTVAPTLPPSATPTRTPTLPPSTTPTRTPTLPPSTTPTPASSPTLAAPNSFHATLAPALEVSGTPAPAPAALVEQPADVVNIALLGADGSGHLTDVIVIASIDPAGPYVSLLSIPRDFYVWIPTHGYDKLNTAYRYGENYPGGGPALFKATIEHNLGIPVHYYAMVGFSGFVQIVNTLGGVHVPVECELHDTFPDPVDPEQGIDVDLSPGMHHLDGQYALWYARSRWSSSDFDRNRRQQQVLRALYRQAMNADVIPRIPELWEALRAAVQTDLGLDNVIWLGWIGGQLDWANVKSRFVGPPFVTARTTDTGLFILQRVPGALEALIAEALQPPATGRANQPAFRVEIWDGSGRPGMAEVAAERLRWEGFAVVGVVAADEIYPRTQIVNYTTTGKGSPVWILTTLYSRGANDVFYEPTTERTADFRILLGVDYTSCVPVSRIQYVSAPTPTPTPAP
jgi:LCP family protein required for cell wall assembly